MGATPTAATILALTLLVIAPVPARGWTEFLSMGDLGGATCGQSQAEWDYLAYDTRAVVPVDRTSWGKLKALYRAGF